MALLSDDVVVLHDIPEQEDMSRVEHELAVRASCINFLMTLEQT